MQPHRLQQTFSSHPLPQPTGSGSQPHPVLLTVEQFSERNPAFTQPALRNLIFKADSRQSSRGEVPGNGLLEAGAILRIGRKVLVDEERFFDWVRQQNGVQK